MDLFTFMADNPWQTFFLGPFVLVVGWFVYVFLGIVLNFTFKLLNRLLRSINIAIRGWPPAHLDADGDTRRPVASKTEKEKKQEES